MHKRYLLSTVWGRFGCGFPLCTVGGMFKTVLKFFQCVEGPISEKNESSQGQHNEK